MMTQSRVFELQATFALNNLAVRLMENSCYAQAFQVLQGAVKALQIGTDAPNQKEGRMVIRKLLEQGMGILSSPQVDRLSIPLNVMFHDQATSLFHSTSFGKTRFTMIRIRENDPKLLEDNSLNLLTAMVLFNLAMAALCKEQCCVEEGMCSSRAYVDTVTILHLAFNLVDQASAVKDAVLSQNDDTYTFPSCNLERSVSMSAVILQALQQSFEAMGQRDQAFACVMRLTDIRNQATVLNNLSDAAYSCAGAA